MGTPIPEVEYLDTLPTKDEIASAQETGLSQGEAVLFAASLAERPPDLRIRNCTYVYFIQGRDGGPIKIGRARSPRKRLAELQVGNPTPLVIRRIVWAPKEMEARLHTLFKADHLQGEWFRASPALAVMADAIPEAEGDATVENPHRSFAAPPPELNESRLGGCEGGTAREFTGYVKPGTCTPTKP